MTAAPSISTGVTGTRRPRQRAAAKTASVRATAERAAPPLESALLRGLENLPLDTRQRARARTLARDPVSRTLADDGHSVESLAAAIAYAIVYIDHVPLTQAEVAASFRVSGASLRGRFSALRAQLHLAPGDTRYRTRR
jgi:transcription initiation factor TFIIIB Brf1 subunit/transcription initiation factor TFIIB